MDLKKTYRHLFFISALLISLPVISQNIGFNWIKQIKGLSAVFGFSHDLKVDGFGNIYIGGRFAQTYDFDPGPGVFPLSTIGNVPFVAKYDANGTLLWARKFDDPSTTAAFGDCLSLAIDNQGNVYCGGTFNNKFDFDPGANTYTLDASNGVGFICKLNSSGNFVWAGQVGKDSSGGIHRIILTNTGNVVACGNFKGQNNDFDPTSSVYNVSATGVKDAFILSLTLNGSFNSVKTIGGINCGFNAFDIIEDLNGNLLLTGGFFGGTADFDPGPNTYTVSGQSSNAYILKLNALGNFSNVWTATNMNNGYCSSIRLQVDNQNNVYSLYFFSTVCDFDPGPGITSFTASGFQDIALCKHTGNGSLLWAKQITGTGTENPYDLVIDNNGDPYVAVHFDAVIDVDPGNSTYTLAPSNGPCSDAAIIKLDNNGNFKWVKHISGAWHKTIRAIQIDLNGNIIASGSAQQGADFDPGPGPSCTHTISALYSDPYILKLSPCQAPAAPVVNPTVATWCGPSAFTLNATTANNLTWRTQLMSNTYIDSVATHTTSVLAPGNYTYYAAAWNCCAESFPPAQINVSVFPIPTISLVASKDTFCLGEPVILTALGGVSYVMGTTFSSGNFTVWPTQNTTYTVNGGDIHNCNDTASIQLIYDPCTAINSYQLDKQITLWPNPTNEQLQLRIEQNGNYILTVVDVLGRIVLQKNIYSEAEQVHLLKLENKGVYEVIISNANARVVKKVVVE